MLWNVLFNILVLIATTNSNLRLWMHAIKNTCEDKWLSSLYKIDYKWYLTSSLYFFFFRVTLA